MRIRRALLALILATSALLGGDPAAAAVAGGDILAYGAPHHGSTAGVALNAPVVDVAASPDGSGYWTVASDGGVFSFGGARYSGSLGAIPLNQPIVAMAPTPSGRGYWLAAADGGVFTFGDAPFLGSTGDRRLTHPVVDIEAAPAGAGYWLVTAGGSVFGFGSARHAGDLTGSAPGSPVVGMAATSAGDGYWLATAVGGVYTFGAAVFGGALAGQRLDEPVTGIDAASSTAYWLVTRDGAVHTFGGAPFRGSAANACKDAVLGVAARAGGGYWLATTPLPAASHPDRDPLDTVARESAQLTSLLRIRQGCQPGASPRRGALAHPLPGARVTSSYGSRTHPVYGRPQVHTGVDFAGGSTALAAAAGTVVEVRERPGYGITVVIDHGDGVGTSYSHLARPAVSSGQAVSRGQAVGTVGRTGFATGDHLHFEVRVHGVHTNPLAWL
ncbi:MAG TPA: M23 family metallopeptidase [Acidimicrobiales bacterium]|nr:M23 family metallopeptidase [Acidimicrobiales bacterium]